MQIVAKMLQEHQNAECGCQKRILQVGKPLDNQIQQCCKLLQIIAKCCKNTEIVAETDRNNENGKQRNQRLEHPSKIKISEHWTENRNSTKILCNITLNCKLQTRATLQNWRPTWGLAMLHATWSQQSCTYARTQERTDVTGRHAKEKTIFENHVARCLQPRLQRWYTEKVSTEAWKTTGLQHQSKEVRPVCEHDGTLEQSPSGLNETHLQDHE